MVPRFYSDRFSDTEGLLITHCRRVSYCQTLDLKSLLEIKTFGDVATVHLKAPPLAPANTDLTKFEVEQIIDGYPPFYRSIILTPGPESYRITHPTKENHHLSRGAWCLGPCGGAVHQYRSRPLSVQHATTASEER